MADDQDATQDTTDPAASALLNKNIEYLLSQPNFDKAADPDSVPDDDTSVPGSKPIPSTMHDFTQDPEYQKLAEIGRGLNQKQHDVVMSGMDKYGQMISDRASTPYPDLKQLPKEPQANQLGQGAMEFMQIATVLGALAGARGRGNATAALNAFGAAVKGFAQGDKEMFDAKTEEWKQASERLKYENQTKLDQYEAIMNNKKLQMDQMMTMVQTVAAQYGDEKTFNMAERKDYGTVAMMLQREKQFQLSFANSQVRMAATVDTMNRAHEKIQRDKDDVNDLVTGIETGLIPPNKYGNYHISNDVLAKLVKDGFNDNTATLEYQGAVADVKSGHSPQTQRYTSLANGVINSIDAVKEAAEKLHLNGMGIVNQQNLDAQLQLEGRSQAVEKPATEYVAAMTTLRGEIARLESGGYAPTEDAWKLADEQVKMSYGYTQIEKSLNTMQRMLRFRFDAQQFLKVPGGPLAANRYEGTPASPPALTGGETAKPAGSDQDLNDALKILGIGPH